MSHQALWHIEYPPLAVVYGMHVEGMVYVTLTCEYIAQNTKVKSERIPLFCAMELKTERSCEFPEYCAIRCQGICATICLITTGCSWCWRNLLTSWLIDLWWFFDILCPCIAQSRIHNQNVPLFQMVLHRSLQPCYTLCSFKQERHNRTWQRPWNYPYTITYTIAHWDFPILEQSDPTTLDFS